jgi:hypothetical protein
MELGVPFSTAEEIVRRDGPPVLEFLSKLVYSDHTSIGPNHIAVVYWSFGGFDRWVCTISFANGRVAEKEVRFID